MNDLEISEKIRDFDIRREKILVKIKEQKLKLARLSLHYAQFMADLARARDLENQLPQPDEDIN